MNLYNFGAIEAMIDGMMSMIMYSLVIGIIVPLALAGFALYFYAMHRASKKNKGNFYIASSLCGIAAIVVALVYWAWLLG